MEELPITVVGGGIFGLWQAFELARRGRAVTLHEALPEAATGASSRIAGAMLAPYCESEVAEPVVLSLGLRGLELWKAAYPGVVARGSLVVAAPRDQSELTRFARLTEGHQWVDADRVARRLASRRHLWLERLLFAAGCLVPLGGALALARMGGGALLP